MIHSGIAPLDQRVGGMFPGRLHMLTGGPGTGKTTACLHFLRSGLDVGDDVVLLTHDEPRDLKSHARSLALELDPVLRSGQLLLLRFRPEFRRALAQAGQPERASEDLERMLEGSRPARLVVDPLSPFLADGTATGAALTALAHWLDRLGATTLLTYPADISNGYDARLEPIVCRAATIVHLSRAAGQHRLHFVQNRVRAGPTTAIRFALRPGAGLVPLNGGRPHAVVRAKHTTNGGGWQPLDRAGLARAIDAAGARDPELQYAVVMLDCENASAATLHELAALAMLNMRASNGDLAATLEGRVVVYLHGARLRDTGPFIERVRTQWSRKHRTALRIESLAYPADDLRVRTLLELTQPA
jgi:KaiC/GvpD/RAD55 family RecA-like ATPase